MDTGYIPRQTLANRQEEIIIVRCQILRLQDQNSIKEDGTGQVTVDDVETTLNWHTHIIYILLCNLKVCNF